jgi:hypothetical protein
VVSLDFLEAALGKQHAVEVSHMLDICSCRAHMGEALSVWLITLPITAGRCDAWVPRLRGPWSSSGHASRFLQPLQGTGQCSHTICQPARCVIAN